MQANMMYAFLLYRGISNGYIYARSILFAYDMWAILYILQISISVDYRSARQ